MAHYRFGMDSTGITRVPAAEMGFDGSIIDVRTGDEFDGFIDSLDGGLPFSAEGSAGIGEVFFTSCNGGVLTRDQIIFEVEGETY